MINKYKTQAHSTCKLEPLQGSNIMSNIESMYKLSHVGLTYRIRIVFIRGATLRIGYLRRNPHHKIRKINSTIYYYVGLLTMVKNFKRLANKKENCFYNVIFILPANIMESKAFKSNQFKTGNN